MLTPFKSLIQPHFDYCCQLWSPSQQSQINKIEKVSRVMDDRLSGLDYWEKLKALRLYS